MKLTCLQMDILLSFYAKNDLSSNLKSLVEDHLSSCSGCKAKYEIIKSVFDQLEENLEVKSTPVKNSIRENEGYKTRPHGQYDNFRTNLSAYIDNELSGDESVKMKKFTISNSHARKELEDSYNIKKLINDSFRKTKSETKHDFARSTLRKLESEDTQFEFHPLIKFLIGFTAGVFVLTTIILFSLSV